jgi:hypothetical protein
MRGKILPVVLPPDVYAELERRARAEERHPIRQATWLLRQALEVEPQEPTGSTHRAERAAAVTA